MKISETTVKSRTCPICNKSVKHGLKILFGKQKNYFINNDNLEIPEGFQLREIGQMCYTKLYEAETEYYEGPTN